MGIEKSIETAIKHFIFAKGGYLTKVQSGAVHKSYKGKEYMIRLADAGTPDMMGCLNGRFIGVEVKKDAKEVQKWLAYPNGLRGTPVKYNARIEAQKNASKQIREAGGFFAVVCSVDELEADLRALGVL